MITPSNLQVLYFFYSIVGGLIVGLLIDCYRSIRYWCCPKGILTAVSDLLFWILCGLLIFLFFLYTNNGDFRYYTIIGMVIGAIVYFSLLSSMLVKAMKWLIYYVGKAIRILLMVIMFPVKAAIYIIRIINSFVSGFFIQQRKKLKGSMSKLKKVKNKEGKTEIIKNNINTSKIVIDKEYVKNKKKLKGQKHTKEKVS